jgi:hypothetical protein
MFRCARQCRAQRAGGIDAVNLRMAKLYMDACDDLVKTGKRDLGPVYVAALANPGPRMDAKALHGFTIVTAEAQGSLVDVHDRRPVVLPADAAAAWLDPATPPRWPKKS